LDGDDEIEQPATTHIGGSPPRALARLILVEMEEARLGNPMFAGVVYASAQ